jgi:hypothetical protein
MSPSSPTSRFVDVERQLVSRPRYPRTDRANRHPAHVGRLAVREPDNLREHEGFAPVARERGEQKGELE